MLEIKIATDELWDETKQEFIPPKEETLKLEHSLVSLSKWESKYCKPFITKEPKTIEETRDYIRFMTLNKNVDPDIYYGLSNSDMEKINAYIDAPMSATTVKKQGGRSREPVTASKSQKSSLSSDCGLQPAHMKLELLVIPNQNVGVNAFPGLVHTARHAMGVGSTQSR